MACFSAAAAASRAASSSARGFAASAGSGASMGGQRAALLGSSHVKWAVASAGDNRRGAAPGVRRPFMVEAGKKGFAELLGRGPRSSTQASSRND
jgi:hypothetical protein